MKNFTTAVIRGLLNQVHREEISFSRMVEIMNERVSERVEEPRFKEGDFVKDAIYGAICIYHDTNESGGIVSHVGCHNGYTITKTGPGWGYTKDFSHATEEEKQVLLDALVKEGKRWNEKKKCIEDIPKRKFKKGDKVRIKRGVSSKTHHKIGLSFVEEMDDFIGKTMTVDRYISGNNYVELEGTEYAFLEEWLEPYEGLKKGDWAIFWDGVKKYAIISIYDRPYEGVEYLRHKDARGLMWANAIKLESKKQYRKLLKGEI